jgi:L-alanine-DL-glutamate epimerase-like enolase superfamily enzyme
MAVAGADLVGLVAADVVGQLEPRPVAGQAHEDVDRLLADRDPADLLEAEPLVEGDRAVEVSDPVAGVDQFGHGRQDILGWMATFDLLSDLPLTVDGYELEGLTHQAPGFERLSTVVKIHGGGEEGMGEDVTYDALDHVALQDAGPSLDLTGHATLGEFCEFIGSVDLFPAAPEREVSRRYRRWAFESAALDLALRQGGQPLHEVLGREPRPVRFVVSMRLAPLGGEQASSLAPLLRKLERYPDTRFKLDPTNDWTDELIAELVELEVVDSLDLKGQYKGTVVDVETDPELYAKLLEAFPDAWIEDPDINEQTAPILEPHMNRVTWDAPIHSIADIESLPNKPRTVNVKPSRVGGLEDLSNTYDYCEEQAIGAYGGGQWELGVGRGHIQLLASIFHPDTPNDTAPGGYNEAEPPEGLPSSPLDPAPTPTGFRWET